MDKKDKWIKLFNNSIVIEEDSISASGIYQENAQSIRNYTLADTNSESLLSYWSFDFDYGNLNQKNYLL